MHATFSDQLRNVYYVIFEKLLPYEIHLLFDMKNYEVPNEQNIWEPLKSP